MSLNLDLISSQFNFSMAINSDRVVYLFDEYRLEKSRRMLYRGTQEVVLPPKAVETLLALIERRGEIVGKSDLMKIIWPDTVVEESNLAQYLHVLRKTLGQKNDGQPFIETLRRRGYRFTSDVRVVESLTGNGTRMAAESQTAVPVKRLEIVKPSRFSPMLGAMAVLAALFASATIWYFQDRLNRVTSNPRGEFSVTPLTNGNGVQDATVSPDGKYFVYNELFENKYRLWMQQVGQTRRIEITPPGEWLISGKTFSPNSEFVYFVGREERDDQDALYRVATLGGPVTRILTDIASPVSFSPDGSKIAFVRHNEKTRESYLVTAAVDGEAQRISLTLSSRETLSLGTAWSPDGKFIAYQVMNTSSPTTEGNCSIKAIEVDTLAVKDLSPERWDTCYRMAWTFDGKGLVFIGTRMAEIYTTRRDQVYYLSVADGRSHRISTDASRYQSESLGLTTNNSLLVVPHQRLSQIWVMDANGDARTAVQLTNGQLDGPAGIAPLPDGRIGYISRVGEDLTIWVMNADGSDQHQIGLPLPFVEELRATPDGRFFIFSASRNGFNHLYRIDTNGQDLKQLTDGESYEISSQVSPDGGWVYYLASIRNGDHWRAYLRKTAIDGSQTVNLKETEPGLFSDLSPDGKLIAAAVGGKLRIFSSSDGALVNSLNTDKLADWWNEAKWTSDSQSLTYRVNRENTINVWVQSLSGSAPRPLTNFTKGYIYSYAFSRDGKKLYVARGYQVRDAVMIRNF
jgi:eukaryotic-like serine/threonine-protein kinase